MGLCLSASEYEEFEKQGLGRTGRLIHRPSMPNIRVHKCHESTHPAYPSRAKVKYISWLDKDPDYDPVDFTAKVVFENDRTIKPNGWADPPNVQDIAKELKERPTYIGTGVLHFNEDGYPLNPIGRTGMKGRGLLGKWGPNFAADPVVTRLHPKTRKLQVVAIQRRDNKQWALPGGMVEYGQGVSETLRKEFEEEAANVPDAQRAQMKQLLDRLFESDGAQVYRGYVDDPRNTDNAWMETTAVHFHCTKDLAKHLILQAGDDAQNVQWLDVDEKQPDFANFYANHKEMVLYAAACMKKKKN